MSWAVSLIKSCSTTTVHGKILVREKNWWIRRIVSHSPKFSSSIFSDTRKTVYGIFTDCCLFAKCFLTNSFYLHGLPKFSPAKYFPCMVAINGQNSTDYYQQLPSSTHSSHVTLINELSHWVVCMPTKVWRCMPAI